ncbi:unnamed protein product [Arabis nemorensis]|uniref:Uncharacterized protein n=1 Tax=Arabis nemorensis TaxID=586526 RepID=A0A565BBX9_9BRAS|nr:unnamed protein product [Arabis nemorensis]
MSLSAGVNLNHGFTSGSMDCIFETPSPNQKRRSTEVTQIWVGLTQAKILQTSLSSQEKNTLHLRTRCKQVPIRTITLSEMTEQLMTSNPPDPPDPPHPPDCRPTAAHSPARDYKPSKRDPQRLLGYHHRYFLTATLPSSQSTTSTHAPSTTRLIPSPRSKVACCQSFSPDTGLKLPQPPTSILAPATVKPPPSLTSSCPASIKIFLATDDKSIPTFLVRHEHEPHPNCSRLPPPQP